MNKLFLMSMLFVGCGERKHPVYIGTNASQVYCTNYVYTYCGNTVYNCNNNFVYTCMNNVQTMELLR